MSINVCVYKKDLFTLCFGFYFLYQCEKITLFCADVKNCLLKKLTNYITTFSISKWVSIQFLVSANKKSIHSRSLSSFPIILTFPFHILRSIDSYHKLLLLFNFLFSIWKYPCPNLVFVLSLSIRKIAGCWFVCSNKFRCLLFFI